MYTWARAASHNTYHITAEVGKPVSFVTQARDVLQALCPRYSVFHYGSSNGCSKDRETQHDTQCYPTLTNILHSRVKNKIVQWKHNGENSLKC